MLCQAAALSVVDQAVARRERIKSSHQVLLDRDLFSG